MPYVSALNSLNMAFWTTDPLLLLNLDGHNPAPCRRVSRGRRRPLVGYPFCPDFLNVAFDRVLPRPTRQIEVVGFARGVKDRPVNCDSARAHIIKTDGTRRRARRHRLHWHRIG